MKIEKLTTLDMTKHMLKYEPCSIYHVYKACGVIKNGDTLRIILENESIDSPDKAWLIVSMMREEFGRYCSFVSSKRFYNARTGRFFSFEDVIYILQDIEEYMEAQDE